MNDKRQQMIIDTDWVERVLARMLVMHPMLNEAEAIATVRDVARFPNWLEMPPEVAAERACARLRARRPVARPAPAVSAGLHRLM
jgi:hypothetical protein